MPLTNRVWLTHVPKKLDDSVGALVVFEAKGRRQFGALYKGSMFRGSFEVFEWQPDEHEGRAHLRLLQDDKSVKIRTESCEPDAGLDSCIMLHGDPLGAVRYQSKRIWGCAAGRPSPARSSSTSPATCGRCWPPTPSWRRSCPKRHENSGHVLEGRSRKTGRQDVSGVAALLDRLVAQFEGPYDFLRELVQNALDAGSDRAEVALDVHPGESADPDEVVFELRVADAGAGMDEAIIDGGLTRLFASTKADDRTMAGGFGIGFVSVFAWQPDAVVVQTGRAGEAWS
ncbi:ATP-binding protein [Nannocystis pusilla]|uniref:ATP-binding protein n=1 Tax=Nannocystis pusilla TaxID=889268 RepID=UPI003B815FA6